jgi:hypothetical protein
LSTATLVVCLQLVDFFQCDAAARDFLEDWFGGGGPGVRPGLVVVRFELFHDGFDEVGNGVKDPAPQCLVGVHGTSVRRG